MNSVRGRHECADQDEHTTKGKGKGKMRKEGKGGGGGGGGGGIREKKKKIGGVKGGCLVAKVHFMNFVYIYTTQSIST